MEQSASSKIIAGFYITYIHYSSPKQKYTETIKHAVICKYMPALNVNLKTNCGRFIPHKVLKEKKRTVCHALHTLQQSLYQRPEKKKNHKNHTFREQRKSTDLILIY